jgi:hypothetical protein
LLAQPAALTCSVNRIGFTSAMVGILQASGIFSLKSRGGNWQRAKPIYNWFLLITDQLLATDEHRFHGSIHCLENQSRIRNIRVYLW